MLDTYQYIESYPIAKIDKPIPFYEVTGKFKVEVPYEVEGWSNGQDLRKMDQKILQEKVVAYYQKLRNLMNNGEGNKWGELTQQRRQETAIFNYSDKNYMNEIYEKEIYRVKEQCKGMMDILEDYKMRIYAEGKLVTLERKSHTKEMNGKLRDAKGESPLIRIGKTKGVEFFPIKLYLPEGSNDFVIIRK